MALALQTFSTVKDANAALKAAGTRYLGGGTLVVRAANEGDVSVSGLIRSTEPAL
ncbi:MAG: xanthine dehydrogenase family protein subunit M, partial [Mesorhizobium sp.]